MTRDVVTKLVHLEGCRVSVAFADGSRLDDCELVSTGHNGTQTLWFFANGTDVFADAENVVDIWEVRPATPDLAG